MSLINQMLKDLEKRSNAKKPLATQLPLREASVPASHRYRKVLWSAVPLLLVSAGLVCFMRFERPRPVDPDPSQLVVDRAPDLPGARPVLSAKVAPLEAKPAVVAIEKAPATLEKLRFEQRADQLQVEIDFSSAPAYGLARGEQGRQLVLDLPKGLMAASLPNTSGLPFLRSVASQRQAGGVQLIFRFNRKCRYDELALVQNPAGRGQTLRFMVQPEPVDLSPVALQAARENNAPQMPDARTRAVEGEGPVPAALSSKPEQSVVRQEVQLSPRVRAANYFREAGTALQQGRQREAETALRAALALDPEHVEVRDMLLRLLVQQNRRADFRALLADGLRQAPQYLPYRVQYARLLIQDGALSDARDHLTREPRPQVVEAPELYAMLATVYQRQGQYAEAAQTYRVLLAVKPEQSVWWMGLGIALEGATLEDQAQQAYRQAISRGGLSSGLQTYIRQRLTVLGNRGAQVPATSMSAGKEPS